MNSFFIIVLIPVIGTLSSVACYMIAEKKNNNPMLWALMGFLLGPVSLPFIALSSEKSQDYSS